MLWPLLFLYLDFLAVVELRLSGTCILVVESSVFSDFTGAALLIVNSSGYLLQATPWIDSLGSL